MLELRYQKGLIIFEGEFTIPLARKDERINKYVAEGIKYKEIINYLESSEKPYRDNVLDLLTGLADLNSNISLRPYQKEALKAWNGEKRGIVIMPTGSGKTILGLKIIEQINSATLIVVPTLDLVAQWKNEIKEAFDIKAGEFTGDSKELKEITVTTYDSAYLNAEYLGNKVRLVIFDEVHHLASEGYRQIAETFATPFRLGLTATYEREDGLHSVLPQIVGEVVYRTDIDDLAGEYLADYNVERISIEFTPDEKKKYEKNRKIFRNYLISRNIQLNSASDFQKIVMRSGRDPAARSAILAHKKAEKIAFNSENKIKFLRTVLNKEDRIIIFTKYNSMVYKISQTFFIPCITHKTSARERKRLLRQFRGGKYTAIVSSRVLDEGIDVPEANIGVIVSGTGSAREYIQRLGRLLRPKENKQAILYELVTKESTEINTAYRRKT
ncbi:MAG: DEAD/DEAH box helicase family protein [Promethearchaeia archaeon]